MILPANIVNRSNRPAQPDRRVLIVCANRVQFERYRATERLSREEAVPICDVADAQRAARLYRSYANREVVLLTRPAHGDAVCDVLTAAGLLDRARLAGQQVPS